MAAEPLTASVFVEASPESVYEYFIRPEAIVRWMGEYAVLEPTPGGQFTVNVHGAPVRGQYLELDPPNRLVISWGYAGSTELKPGASTIEVRFIAQPGGTRVELEHRDLPDEQRRDHAIGWNHYLARLQLAGCGSYPGPDPGM